MDCIILAGGKCDDELRRLTGEELRANIPFAGKRMVEIVVEALRAALPTDTQFIAVGATIDGATQVSTGRTFIESLTNGMELVTADTFLIATSDIPFLSRDAVSHFLEHSDLDCAFNFPIIPIEKCNMAFPGMKRTTLKLREGKFTGGNIALANRALFQKILPVIEAAYANRKKPAKLAMQVGLSTLARVALGQAIPATLPLEALEKRIARFLGAPVHAVISPHPELGADIDSAEHCAYAKNLIELGVKPTNEAGTSDK